jgi:hypothetical protein
VKGQGGTVGPVPSLRNPAPSFGGEANDWATGVERGGVCKTPHPCLGLAAPTTVLLKLIHVVMALSNKTMG